MEQIWEERSSNKNKEESDGNDTKEETEPNNEEDKVIEKGDCCQWELLKMVEVNMEWRL